jgi:DNA-binding GntR family transcriptional regulator
LVQDALDYLMDEILSDRLRPNQRISEEAVAKRLGVSRSPVREALRILERDGLVKKAQNRGLAVTDITPEEADELYLIHGHLMSLAVRLACQKMTDEGLGRLEELVAALRAAAENGDRQEFLDCRAGLERLIAESSLSPRLAHLLEVMGYPCIRYRAFHVSVPGYMNEISRRYEGICKAFRDKDDAKAEKLRVEIIELGRKLLHWYFIEPLRGLKGAAKHGESIGGRW